MTMSEQTIRRAVVQARNETEAIRLAKTVKAYLPSNYEVTGVHGAVVTIEGFDRAGWTLEDYVVPRLASGLIHAEIDGECPADALYRRFRAAHNLPEDPWTPGAHERAVTNPVPAREYEPGYDAERELQDWMNELRRNRRAKEPESEPEPEWTSAGAIRGGVVVNDLGGQDPYPRFGADDPDV